MIEILNNGVVQVVLLGTVLLGIVSGILGVFTLLRKQALIGDALSHATLPGVVLMFMFTKSKEVSVLIIGAAISAGIAMLTMRIIKKYTKLQGDAILALILSSFFGLGRFLISLISRKPEFSKAKLDDFIFGSAATIIERDIITLLVVLVFILVLIVLFWRQIKTQTFDAQFYTSLGFSNEWIEFLMSFMTILVIVSGIRSVGVILMSSLLIAPGLASRQWSHNLSINVFLSALFGAISAFVGTLISVTHPTGLPTGPVIVSVGTLIAFISIFFAPQSGVIAKEIQRQRHRKDIQTYRSLLDVRKGFTIKDSMIDKLLKESYVSLDEMGNHHLTSKGEEKVKEIVGVNYHG